MTDHITAEQLDLNGVRDYFGGQGYRVLSLEQKWRHVTGHLKEGEGDLFLKMASTPGIATRTANEASWNRAVVEKLAVKIPKVVKEGEWNGLFWMLTEYVDGIELAKAEGTTDMGLLTENMDLIAQTAVDILNLKNLPLLPKEKAEPLEPLGQKFMENIAGWKEKIHLDVAALYDYVERGIASLQTAPCHGDFVPWHFLFDKSGQVFLVDGEAARSQGVKFYDVAYFYQRVYTKQKRPEMASKFLDLFKNKFPMTGQDQENFRVVLAQRLIGGYLDAETDKITSVELQNKLKEELLGGAI